MDTEQNHKSKKNDLKEVERIQALLTRIVEEEKKIDSIFMYTNEAITKPFSK
jgi:hypothetical protein